MSLKKVAKGDTVILKGFTGIKLGVFEVEKATEKNITISKQNGDKLIFSRATGKQLNVEEGKEKWASSIMEDDGSYVRPQRKKKTKAVIEEEKEKPIKKSKKQKAAEIEESEEIEEEDEEEVNEESMDDDFDDFEEE